MRTFRKMIFFPRFPFLRTHFDLSCVVSDWICPQYASAPSSLFTCRRHSHQTPLISMVEAVGSAKPDKCRLERQHAEMKPLNHVIPRREERLESQTDLLNKPKHWFWPWTWRNLINVVQRPWTIIHAVWYKNINSLQESHYPIAGSSVNLIQALAFLKIHV